MTGFGSKYDLARSRDDGEEAKVEFVELFFDLVFVLAVTQISHLLLRHLSVLGAFQSAFLLLAVWWVWVFTAWVTNWMDPRRAAVKFLLFSLMLAGLVLSSSLPDAFEARGLAFAAAYVFMQVGRSAFMLWALRRHNADNFRNFLRITQWLVLSGFFWLAGAIAEGEARFAFWIAALAIEYAGPASRFWTPWNGASSTEDWDVEGGHMAERSALFIIIALGESVLVTGATFAEMEWTWPVIAAFLVSFLGTVAMWWLYFNVGAEKARHDIEHAEDPAALRVSPIPTCRCCWSQASWWRRLPTNWCSPTPSVTIPNRRRSLSSSAGRRSMSSVTCSSSAFPSGDCRCRTWLAWCCSPCWRSLRHCWNRCRSARWQQ